MALPASRADLINYCKQQLGEPVIQVNLSQYQLNNAVDDALQFWREYHEASHERTYFVIQLTQAMVDTATIPLPENVISVERVLNPNLFGATTSNNESLFNYNYQFMQANIWDMMKFGGGTGYFVMQNYLAEMTDLFINAPPFRYAQYTGEVHVDTLMQHYLQPGQYIVIECYAWLDEVKNPRLWQDRYLRKLATAYMKRSWGGILSKFGGVTLPSGIQLNGNVLLEEATQEIIFAENEIKAHQVPLGMVIR